MSSFNNYKNEIQFHESNLKTKNENMPGFTDNFYWPFHSELKPKLKPNRNRNKQPL